LINHKEHKERKSIKLKEHPHLTPALSPPSEGAEREKTVRPRRVDTDFEEGWHFLARFGAFWRFCHASLARAGRFALNDSKNLSFLYQAPGGLT